ncbi:hypothetical protein WA588_006169, partial [Blastocystis sp. NMH]
MSSVAVKSEDARTSSPTSADVYVPEFEESPDLRIRSMSLAEAARKESHRASERKRRERLSLSMNMLDKIIRNTRKFSNKRSVKLDKNSVIEHAIAYIRELQQVNELYAKRLEEANTQIAGLQNLLLLYNRETLGNPILPATSSPPLSQFHPVLYPSYSSSIPVSSKE